MTVTANFMKKQSLKQMFLYYILLYKQGVFYIKSVT